MALGRLRVIERVRSGVAGAVYLAIDEAAGRSLAVEILVSDPVESGGRRRALVDEARAAAALAHPNIAPVLEAGEVDQRVYLAMDPLRGASLAGARVARAAAGRRGAPCRERRSRVGSPPRTRRASRTATSRRST